MSRLGTSAQTLSSFQPSGRFSLLLLPLTALAVVLAIVMANVLYLCEAELYYYFITPLIVAAPVYGALWLALQYGRCRNALIGIAICVATVLLYYIGYWQISYQRNIVAHG